MPRELTIPEKAREGLAAGAVEPSEDRVYYVRSRSRSAPPATGPGLVYRVVLPADREKAAERNLPLCDCHAGRHQSLCWHLVAARRYEEDAALREQRSAEDEAFAELEERLRSEDRAAAERRDRFSDEGGDAYEDMMSDDREGEED